MVYYSYIIHYYILFICNTIYKTLWVYLLLFNFQMIFDVKFLCSNSSFFSGSLSSILFLKQLFSISWLSFSHLIFLVLYSLIVLVLPNINMNLTQVYFLWIFCSYFLPFVFVIRVNSLHINITSILIIYGLLT